MPHRLVLKSFLRAPGDGRLQPRIPARTLLWSLPISHILRIRYCQHRPDRKVVKAYWLTNFTCRQASARSVYRMVKSRWRIQNQGFNDAKNRYGIEHICHHQPNSLLAQWLIVALAIERCYPLRNLHRDTQRMRTAIELLRQLWFNLLRPRAWDSS